MCVLGFSQKVKYTKDRERPEYLDWELLDFQKFIDEHNIERPVDLKRNYKNIYATLRRRGYTSSDLDFKITKIPTQKKAFQEIVKRCNELDYEFINKDTWIYKNRNTSNIKLKCKIHGTIWTTSYVCFIFHGTKCPLCSIRRSKGEEYVTDFLNSKKIYFEIQVSPDFIGRKSLDIYLPEYNLAIEVQSEIHMFSIDYFGGEKGFERRVRLDKEKYKECCNNNLTLLYFIYLDNISTNQYKERILEAIPNYFAPVYTSLDDLWNRIQEIIAEKNKSEE